MGCLWPPLCQTDCGRFFQELVAKSNRNPCARLKNSPLRTVHVIAGLDRAYGGPSYTVPRLCQALTTTGAEAQLLSVAGTDGGDITPDGVGCCFPRDWARVPMLRDLRCSSKLADRQSTRL